MKRLVPVPGRAGVLGLAHAAGAVGPALSRSRCQGGGSSPVPVAVPGRWVRPCRGAGAVGPAQSRLRCRGGGSGAATGSAGLRPRPSAAGGEGTAGLWLHPALLQLSPLCFRQRLTSLS